MPTPESRHQYVHENHRLERFVFADATSRAAGSGLTTPSGAAYTIVAADISQIAFQTDTSTYWRLTGVGPLAWVQITGTGTPTGPAGGDLTGTYPNPTIVAALLTAKESTANKGVANGYAGLDSGGKVPTGQLPASVLGAVDYQGAWNAATNSPALASGIGTKGFYYKVSADGATSLDGNVGWHIGDWVVFDGTVWEKIDNYELVVSVAGRIGAITLTEADIAGLIADLAGMLKKTDNLASIASPIAARGFLGLGDASTHPASDFILATTPTARSCVITLCAGYTPFVTGADVVELTVPYSPADGTTVITWNVRRIDFRVKVSGGAPAITVEVSTAAGAFSPVTVGTVTLGSGTNEGSVTATLGTVASGNKLRFNVGTLGTATGWTIEVTLGN